MSTLHETLRWALDARRPDDEPTVVCFSAPGDDDAQRWESAVVPEEWSRRHVPLDEAGDWSRQPEPTAARVLIVAPFHIRIDELGGSQAFAAKRDGWRGTPQLPPALLVAAVRNGQPGQRFAALVPNGAFAMSYPEPRQALLERADVRLVVESNRSWSDELGIHGAFRMAVIAIECRSIDQPTPLARFLRLPSRIDERDVRKELSALFKQRGGTTPHGYVHRGPLDPARPLHYAANDPAVAERRERLRELGEVRALGDLVEIRQGGVHLTNDAHRIGTRGVPILSRRDVALGDRRLDDDAPRILDPDDRALLRAGDLCVPAIAIGPRLRVRQIHDDELPLAASHPVLVMRPRVELDNARMAFLVDYLRSPRAAGLLEQDGMHGRLRLRASVLARFPVPLPDETLLSALDDLRGAGQQFREWAAEVQQAIDGVLDDTADAGVLQLRTAGQLLRHRVAAAQQLDELGYRIRNLFPFPVALPWRHAHTADHDLGGYRTVLACAESLAGYLAALSILLARNLPVELGAVSGLRTKLCTRGHGVSMSDWTAIVREVAGKAVARTATETTPLVELTELMVDGSPALRALEALTDLRNDLAHNRGPTGSRVAPAYEDAMEHLSALYEECEWLVDYPLRLIEDISWDTYENTGTYRYRELVGDHYLVRQQVARTNFPTLDRERLYVRDRAGDLHLLSPLVLWHECDDCHVPSAFLLDGYDRKAPACRMRAMDHPHSITRPELVRPFEQLGVLGSHAAPVSKSSELGAQPGAEA